MNKRPGLLARLLPDALTDRVFVLYTITLVLFVGIGLGLFLMELVIPGFFIFFFGLGAWVTALVCLIGNPGVNLQIIIFICPFY